MAGLPSAAFEERFRALDGNSKVDAELELLRRNMRPVGALPAPKDGPAFNVRSGTGNKELDEEYERLRRDIRGR